MFPPPTLRIIAVWTAFDPWLLPPLRVQTIYRGFESNTAWKRAQPVTGYTRQDVLRILRIDSRHLRAWERAHLVASSETYTFQELGYLRKLRDLRAMHLSPSSIRASVDAMRKVSGIVNPLLEAGAACHGSRLTFRHSGAVMEPIARQFVFDFTANRRPEQSIAPAPVTSTLDAITRALFFEAVQLEGAAQLQDAARIYSEILDLDAGHAPACINLGTIYYNQGKFPLSEELYRRATQSDPGYALAYFDLGNALDELQRLPEAIEAYSTAIRLVPGYADSHYNLALAYERTGQRRKALLHWTAYLKLDNTGPWASHARGQARKILDREKLSIVHRSGRPGGPCPSRSATQLKLASPAAV
ncbi:MAG TPA: tetratricopeptide repeat protein [Acidisarcina sp.]